MTAFYHVCLRYTQTRPEPDKLEPVFDRLGNWARLNAFNWYIWSEFTSHQLYEELRQFLTADDSIAIFEVRPETAAGWAPQWFWNWVHNKGKSEKT